MEYRKVNDTGKVKYNNCWITALSVAPSTLERLMLAGRVRWKVENKTFNPLKNQGYGLEPDNSHGHKHFTIIFGIIYLTTQTRKNIVEFIHL